MLKIKNLTVNLCSQNDPFYILRNISFNINRGEILGFAGESGSGKSVLAKTILGLNKPPIKTTSGEIIYNGTPLKSNADFKAVRGKKISMIFQTPTVSLNPVMTIGYQLVETIRLHNPNISKQTALKLASELLEQVEIDRPSERLSAYPHQLSGGMNQRVMIAIALASNPELLIADEPTTALDVTVQAQIIKLLLKLNKERHFTMMFISHDLSLLMSICSRIAVLYCGELMEIATKDNLIKNLPYHPYTEALKNCIPKIGKHNTLTTIKGSIGKNNHTADNSCIFAQRCSKAKTLCTEKKPIFNGKYACHFPLLKQEVN